MINRIKNSLNEEEIQFLIDIAKVAIDDGFQNYTHDLLAC